MEISIPGSPRSGLARLVAGKLPVCSSFVRFGGMFRIPHQMVGEEQAVRGGIAMVNIPSNSLIVRWKMAPHVLAAGCL
jgi:hypothetical protein